MRESATWSFVFADGAVLQCEPKTQLASAL